MPVNADVRVVLNGYDDLDITTKMKNYAFTSILPNCFRFY